MSKVIDFLKDTKIELSKVTWPSFKITSKYTLIVILMSAAVALFLALWDIIFQTLLKDLILQ